MKIGFIGLGNVGGKLAGSLQENCFELIVRDIDKAAAEPFLTNGAQWAKSPKALAESADLIITCLGSPAIVSEVMESEDGVIAGLSDGKIWLEMSTTDEAEVKRIGALVAAKGAIPLDSPVSGGCHRAATGNIAILVGGDRQGFEKAFPAISVMGNEILHTGPLGSASVMKVITNYLAGVHLVALGEAWSVAKLSGMDLSMAYEAIRISSGNSFVHETESQIILNGSYNINFTMDLALKDMSIFNDLGHRYGVPMEIAPLTLDVIKDGLDRFGKRAWSSMVVKRKEDDCCIDFRAEGFPECLEDFEPSKAGKEIKVRGRDIDC